jgi:hypothetical protein
MNTTDHNTREAYGAMFRLASIITLLAIGLAALVVTVAPV